MGGKKHEKADKIIVALSGYANGVIGINGSQLRI